MMKTRNLTLLAAAWTVVSALLLSLPVSAATFDIDTGHSAVDFKIKHLGISNVKGSFHKFTGTFEFEEGKQESWKVEAVIDVASIDTGDEKRDAHLLNEDFFNVEKNPTMTFKSTGVKAHDGDYQLLGNLTMNGVTKPVTLDLKFNGQIADPWGNIKVGFTAEGKINRKDYGLSYGKVLEGGGLMIGHEVKIMLEIEGTQQK